MFVLAPDGGNAPRVSRPERLAGESGQLAGTSQGRWEDLRADLVALTETMNVAGDGSVHVPSEYLVVIGHKAG